MDNAEIVEFVGYTKATVENINKRLTAIEASLDKMTERQSVLQMSWARMLGWMAGAATVGGAVASMITKMLHI